eukprot:364902-Chlamydomonas_euryale.AAC.20
MRNPRAFGLSAGRLCRIEQSKADCRLTSTRTPPRRMRMHAAAFQRQDKRRNWWWNQLRPAIINGCASAHVARPRQTRGWSPPAHRHRRAIHCRWYIYHLRSLLFSERVPASGP